MKKERKRALEQHFRDLRDHTCFGDDPPDALQDVTTEELVWIRQKFQEALAYFFSIADDQIELEV